MTAGHCPVRSIAAHGNRQDVIKRLGEDTILKRRVGQHALLHVNSFGLDGVRFLASELCERFLRNSP